MIERIAQILCELISIESISANSNLDIIDYIERLLASSGVSARRVPSSDGRKASLLATIGPADRAGLVLSAHTDVVPVDGQHGPCRPLPASLAISAFMAAAPPI